MLQATSASDQAKAAVQHNSRVLQQKLAERAKLLSQLEQAKMQEQMNKAMASLNEAVGDDVPTLNEVRDKIDARYAKAKAMAELNEMTVDASIREIEEATANATAQARLSELRSELGLEGAAGLEGLEAGSEPDQPETVRPSVEREVAARRFSTLGTHLGRGDSRRIADEGPDRLRPEGGPPGRRGEWLRGRRRPGGRSSGARRCAAAPWRRRPPCPGRTRRRHDR